MTQADKFRRAKWAAPKTADVQASDCYDFILANPPFGASEVEEVKQNFLIKSGETAYLFLQHFIKHLRAGGRAGIVIKNTFLSNGDATSLRRELLESCNLYAVFDLPQKVFSAGVKTVVLFFEKGIPTEKIWYYQLNLDRNLGKTNPLNESDLAEFADLFSHKKDGENSWSVRVTDLDRETLDLSVKNPHKQEEVVQRTPTKIAAEVTAKNYNAQPTKRRHPCGNYGVGKIEATIALFCSIP